MQALWSTLHNPDDSVATVAFRVLGKFGGSNRKMLSTPQPVSIFPIWHTVIRYIQDFFFFFFFLSITDIPSRAACSAYVPYNIIHYNNKL